MATEPPRVLGYSTPRCFFEREYHFRSWNGVVGAAVLLGAAGFAALMARFIPPTSGLPMRVAHAALWTVAGLCAAGAGWVLFNLLRDRVDLVRITEEGIEQNRRLYPWGGVAALGGTAVVGGILLEFQTRPASGPSVGLLRTVMTTPPLKRDEFEALLQVLSDHLATEHPHVKVNPVPRAAE
jgi:hypothetical protein